MCAQVKVQTVPGFANGLMDGMPKFIQQEGVAGCACMPPTPCMHACMVPSLRVLPQPPAASRPRQTFLLPGKETGCGVLRRLFKGLVPLWGRQIPYTMMKFCARCLPSSIASCLLPCNTTHCASWLPFSVPEPACTA